MATTIVTLALVMLVSSLVAMIKFRADYREALITGSYGMGHFIADLVEEILELGLPLDSVVGMNEKLAAMVNQAEHIAYAGIVGLDGRPIFHSQSELVGREFKDQAMIRSLAAHSPITQVYHRFDGATYYDQTVPIFTPAGEHLGLIRLGFPARIVNRQALETLVPVALNFLLAFVVVAVLLNLFLSRLVSRRLDRLAQHARQITGGDFQPAVALAPTGGSDEFDQLAASLAEMAATIQQQLADLRQSRDELEKRVAARTAELARSNSELEQFAYAVSHDLRQPLRMISGHLQILERSLGVSLVGDELVSLRYAGEGARRMDQMIVGILNYSRVGRKSEPHQALATRTSLAEALNFLAPAIAARQAEIKISGEWPEVVASRDELTRLLQNLLDNAIKYVPAQRQPRVLVHSEVKAGLWRVDFQDNGVGVDPTQRNRLFQVFSRLQSREHFEGSGVGLALCRKIVEYHGGRIGVESAGEDQGSTFWFELPLVGSEQSATNDRLG